MPRREPKAQAKPAKCSTTDQLAQNSQLIQDAGSHLESVLHYLRQSWEYETKMLEQHVTETFGAEALQRIKTLVSGPEDGGGAATSKSPAPPLAPAPTLTKQTLLHPRHSKHFGWLCATFYTRECLSKYIDVSSKMQACVRSRMHEMVKQQVAMDMQLQHMQKRQAVISNMVTEILQRSAGGAAADAAAPVEEPVPDVEHAGMREELQEIRKQQEAITSMLMDMVPTVGGSAAIDSVPEGAANGPSRITVRLDESDLLDRLRRTLLPEVVHEVTTKMVDPVSRATAELWDHLDDIRLSLEAKMHIVEHLQRQTAKQVYLAEQRRTRASQ